MSERGQGTCSNCKSTYCNRYKPLNCKNCGFHLGGSYVPKPKKSRPYAPDCVLVANHGANAKIFSVKTHNRDTRCLVVQENGTLQCLSNKCLQTRSTFVNSQQSQHFSCAHTSKLTEAVSPMKILQLSSDNISSYACDEQTKQQLTNIMQKSSLPSTIQVSDTMYCINGLSSSTNSIGYCHVKSSSDRQEIVCSCQECNTHSSKTKHFKHKKICLHVHVLLCVTQDQTPSSSTSTITQPASTAPPFSSLPESPLAEPPANLCRDSTINLNMQNTIPYAIPQSIINIISEIDSKTVLNLNGGWPVVFSPWQENCPLCNSVLSEPRSHPGQRSQSSGFLVTNAVPFRPTKILVKMCRGQNCKAMVQVFPYETALFNISDKLLLSLDILLEWRAQMKRGVSITVAIESKLEVLLKKSDQEIPLLAYMTDLLYNGFYCFESMTTRNMDDGICGICGVLGEIYLGDGNEKNCCSASEIDYTPPPSEENSPISLEEFLLKIKRLWIERTSFTRVENSFQVNAFKVPPIIAPQLRGDELINTEFRKRSVYLKKDVKKIEGDPALLHVLIKQGLNMTEVEAMDLASLRELNVKCGISGHLSDKSKQYLLGNIEKLHASLLVGNCPCHAFTQVKGCTGGFYHFVCRHGVTVASKFLLLQESVRDAADLYLSLKYPPTVFVCDTACGFVRHMDCRHPEIGQELWGAYSGCFEVPSLSSAPSKDVDAPLIVPSEFKRAGSLVVPKEEEWVHPLNGSKRRYVLGDRFHSSNNPHKSPLCAFHDINNCLQSNTLSTSYQECENNRKNKKRLASSTQQEFRLHFLYNYLMDFYQNEMIVQQQRQSLEKSCKDGWVIQRDPFMRFVFVKKDTQDST